MINEDYNYLFKTVLIGDTGVGKTSIAEKFVDNEFNNNFETTIGVDFKAKIVESNDLKFKIQIWDTAGQEKFRNIIDVYFRRITAAIIVYDITDKNTYDNIPYWIDAIKDQSPKCYIFIVSNKIDLEDHRSVLNTDIEEFCKIHNYPHFECSSKQNTGITELFDSMIDIIYDDLMSGKIKPNDRNGIQLYKDSIKINKPDLTKKTVIQPFKCCTIL